MADKPKIYWDACLFYEVLGDEKVTPTKRAAVEEILIANLNNENLIVTSVITHLEVLPAKLEGKKADAAAKYMKLFDGKRYLDVEISANILMRARDIRDFYFKPADLSGHGGKMMDLGDAIHLATATIYGAGEFHTRDADDKGSKIPLLKLYEYSGVPKVCGKWDLKIESPDAKQGALNGVLDQPPSEKTLKD